ncbi:MULTISPECIES: hypothetical protein [Phyllobacteriaceae]|jgi:DNA-binding PadR family transcriptional regulator|uniref:Uncharacterized protein n=1 Tax=Mesorhizobium hungaricum TaxID=1566387 RepID=A0A1C2DP03_9HYPH|nr:MULTISPECIES: hypothetical protein [Mesorhizobium]MBN9233556.1 hypothetical protein [Mesorhizobium sp.]MDQ0328636.1 DNA-binding PadR family transcriptional regulator [Mesorhizobium sp. YL-MeA3-2017]OCX16508.1 hypothetical protein QV13_17045 [Mesorhizobium hungaricum]
MPAGSRAKSSNEIDPFTHIREEEQALQVLRILLHDAFGGHGSNRTIGACLEEIGLYGSPTQIREILQRLEAQGLLRSRTVEGYDEAHLIVSLTDEGERVARGKQMADGVARPSRD